MAPHKHQGSMIFTSHVMRLSWENKAASQTGLKWHKRAGKGHGLLGFYCGYKVIVGWGFLCSFRSVHSWFELSTSALGEGELKLSNQLAQIWSLRGRRGGGGSWKLSAVKHQNMVSDPLIQAVIYKAVIHKLYNILYVDVYHVYKFLLLLYSFPTLSKIISFWTPRQ